WLGGRFGRCRARPMAHLRRRGIVHPERPVIDAEPQLPIVFCVAAVIDVVDTHKLWIFYGTGPHSSKKEVAGVAVVEFSAKLNMIMSMSSPRNECVGHKKILREGRLAGEQGARAIERHLNGGKVTHSGHRREDTGSCNSTR